MFVVKPANADVLFVSATLVMHDFHFSGFKYQKALPVSYFCYTSTNSFRYLMYIFFKTPFFTVDWVYTKKTVACIVALTTPFSHKKTFSIKRTSKNRETTCIGCMCMKYRSRLRVSCYQGSSIWWNISGVLWIKICQKKRTLVTRVITDKASKITIDMRCYEILWRFLLLIELYNSFGLYFYLYFH